MDDPAEGQSAEGSVQLPWYVYDRHANLLHVARTLSEAEAWAFEYWHVVEVGDREEVADNDYWYLLLAAKSDQAHFQSRDFQARIVRQDRVIALGRDPQATPRYPE